MHTDEQQIRELVMTWMTATKSGDVETILGLVADDVVFLRPGHPPLIGKSAFAAAAQRPPDQPAPQFEGTNEIQEIRVLGDWAYMWSKLSVVITLPDGSPPMMRSGHTLSVFKKKEGQWVLARDANMLAPTEAK